MKRTLAAMILALSLTPIAALADTSSRGCQGAGAGQGGTGKPEACSGIGEAHQGACPDSEGPGSGEEGAGAGAALVRCWGSRRSI